MHLDGSIGRREAEKGKSAERPMLTPTGAGGTDLDPVNEPQIENMEALVPGPRPPSCAGGAMESG